LTLLAIYDNIIGLLQWEVAHIKKYIIKQERRYIMEKIGKVFEIEVHGRVQKIRVWLERKDWKSIERKKETMLASATFDLEYSHKKIPGGLFIEKDGWIIVDKDHIPKINWYGFRKWTENFNPDECERKLRGLSWLLGKFCILENGKISGCFMICNQKGEEVNKKNLYCLRRSDAKKYAKVLNLNNFKIFELKQIC